MSASWGPTQRQEGCETTFKRERDKLVLDYQNKLLKLDEQRKECSKNINL